MTKDSRGYSLVVQEGVKIEDVIETLQFKDVEHLYYIKHDKDKDKDGNDKRVHYHIFLYFKSATSMNRVYKVLQDKFKDKINAISIRSNLFNDKAYEYLTHSTDKEKYQYKEEEIVKVIGDGFKSKICLNKNVEEDSAILDELDKIYEKYGYIRLRELILTIGLARTSRYYKLFDVMISQERGNCCTLYPPIVARESDVIDMKDYFNTTE